HLPLHRQLQGFKRNKIPIAPSTIEGWVRQSLKVLDFLYQPWMEDIKKKGYLQADETTIKVIDKKKKGTTHCGYYWVYHSPVDGTVLFDYKPSRSQKAADYMLKTLKVIFRAMVMRPTKKLDGAKGSPIYVVLLMHEESSRRHWIMIN